MIDTRYMYPNEYTKEFLEFAAKDYQKKEKLRRWCLMMAGNMMLISAINVTPPMY